jgi:hypothetical protein
MHTYKKLASLSKKIGRKQFLQHNFTDTTTCDPWERGKMYSRLEKSNMYDRIF